MLFACAVYVSSGATSITRRVAAAANAAHSHIAVVDTFTDAGYDRSSVKLVGESEALVHSARAAVAEAVRSVDLTQQSHPAAHPRQGAADMVSFMPLSAASNVSQPAALAACDTAAWRLGEELQRSACCPVLMFGPRAGRSLLETRHQTSFFDSCRHGGRRDVTTSLHPDFGRDLIQAGSLPQTCGITIVGAQPYVTNFNVQVRNTPLHECRTVAKALRSEMGVQVMALPHRTSGTVEIACNLQATEVTDCQSTTDVLEFIGKYLPPDANIASSYVIGLTPAEAKSKAASMLLG